MYDKEQIYDEKINPLMSEIIRVCKENNIQMFASFALKECDENGEDMLCSTFITSPEYTSSRLDDAVKVVKNGYVVQKPYFIATTITKL